MSKRKGGSHLENALAKFQKVQQQSAKISIDASKDRARLDARSTAQAERLKAAADLEAKSRAEKDRNAAALAPPSHENLVATNWLMKQKRVMDLLHKFRKPMSTAELHNELGWPVDAPELWEMLTHNDKVSYDDTKKRFSYKAKHVLRDRREMLALIHKFPDGVLESDVVDSYLGAADDAAALLESGDVLFLVNAESRERVLYPIDDFYEAVGTVAEEVSGAFHAVQIPTFDPDWDAALRGLGMEPAPRRAVRNRGGDDDSDDEFGNRKKKKKKRPVNFDRMKVTNAHLPELFKAPQVDRVD